MKSNSTYQESAGKAKIAISHAPDRQLPTGISNQESVKGRDMKDTGLSHSLSGAGSVKSY